MQAVDLDFVGLRMKMFAFGVLLSATAAAAGQTCTTQSAMSPNDRENLAATARVVASGLQKNDQAAVRAVTDADLARDFSGVAGVMGATAPHLTGKTLQVQMDQLYLLDASTEKTTSDAQFDCTLNQSAQNVSFAIPQLPPGKYGFTMVRFPGSDPWQVSMLLRQDASGKWLLAGLYPKAMTAGGHDGIWYWTTARGLVAEKHAWAGWLYYQEAESLLQPAGFVGSSHLEKLGTELTEATPPPAKGIGDKAPLVIKSGDGQEFHFTSVGVDDSLGNPKPDIAAHLKVDALGDAASARKRNGDAATALLAAHPELRENFHGVVVLADVPGQNPYATEQAMAEIR